jgi:peroxiredoxin
MKRILVVLVGLLMLETAAWAVTVGGPASDFTGTDSQGRTQKLSDYRGKFVVLEWHNNGCPYTQKHYNSGNMQRLQKEWTAKGVVWFTIISSVPNTEGYVTAAEENAYMAKMQASPTAAILDSTGQIGKLYSAKTTPQMIVISPQGSILYDGAIDDHPSSDISDIARSKNYVSAALQEATAGKTVSVSSTKPYGCSVKYSRWLNF